MDRGQRAELPANADQPPTGRAVATRTDRAPAAYEPFIGGSGQPGVHGKDSPRDLGTQSTPRKSWDGGVRMEPLFDTPTRDTPARDTPARDTRMQDHRPAWDRRPPGMAEVRRVQNGWERNRGTPELRLPEVDAMLDRSLLMRGGNGRVFLEPGDGRAQDFARKIQPEQGTFMIVAVAVQVPVWDGRYEQDEVGVKIGDRVLDVDQFNDLLQADPAWIEHRDHATLDLMISKAGRREPGGPPSFAAFTAAKQDSWVQAPTSDVWMVNANKFVIAPPSRVHRDTYARVPQEFDRLDGQLLTFNPRGHVTGGIDYRPEPGRRSR
jgi:hypothetical protein